MEIDKTQAAAVYALLEGIMRATQDNVQDCDTANRLASAATLIMTQLTVEDE